MVVVRQPISAIQEYDRNFSFRHYNIAPINDMDTQQAQQFVFHKLRIIGKAVGRVNGNNTHSGNFSMRDPLDSDLFHITASGSQCGDLIEQDIVPIRFSGVSWGDARGSSESTIHRSVLSLPGVRSVIHSHHLNTIYVSFDSRENPLFLDYLGLDDQGREEFLFHPVDLSGSFIVGGVKVGSFLQPVGSLEMEERIPAYLKDNQLTIVRGHGPFARGSSPEDALYRLDMLESSAALLLHLRRRGVDVIALQQKIRENASAFFGCSPRITNFEQLAVHEVNDASIVEDFRQRLNYNYNTAIAAFGTGSMSQKISSEEMIYCPMSSVPEEMDFPLLRKPIAFCDTDTTDERVHKLIYRHTHQNTCMITGNPLATAEGMAVLAETCGEQVLFESEPSISYTSDHHPVVLPIDAEAIYLNPKVGLVHFRELNDLTAENPILNMLRWYKGCCIVAGYGVISTGETTLEQAAHNASSAERIAQFRASVYLNHRLLNGPRVQDFEPD